MDVSDEKEKVAILETHLAHELTHATQYNNLSIDEAQKEIIVDKMPSLVECEIINSTNAEALTQEQLAEEHLAEAILEADCRSTAYMVALKSSNVSEQYIECMYAESKK